MHQTNEIEHQRLTNKNDKICGRTIGEILTQMFQNRTMPDINKFLADYEIFCREEQQQLCFIIRGVKLRLKKYYYLPPVYLLFDLTILKKPSNQLQPQHLNYAQKLQPISELVVESKKAPERAYFLSKHPFQTLYHPHIDSIGCACYGHWVHELDNTLGIHHYFETIRAFLHDYNFRSTFFNINPYDWDTLNRYKVGPYVFERGFYFNIMNELNSNIIHDFCKEAKEYGLYDMADYDGKEHFITELIKWGAISRPYRVMRWNEFFARKAVEYGLIETIQDCLTNDYTEDDIIVHHDVDYSDSYWTLERTYNLNQIGRDIGNWWAERNCGGLMLRGDVDALQHGMRTWQFMNKVGKLTTSRQRYSELNTFLDSWSNNSREMGFYILLKIGDTDFTGLLAQMCKYTTAWDKQFESSAYTDLYHSLITTLDNTYHSHDPFSGPWFDDNVFVDRQSITINDWKCFYKELDWKYLVARQIIARLKTTVEEQRARSGRQNLKIEDTQNALSAYLNNNVDKAIKKMKPIILTLDEAYKNCLRIMWESNHLVGESINQAIIEKTGYNMRNIPLGDNLERIPFDYDVVLDFIRGVIPDFPDKQEDFLPYMSIKTKSVIQLALQKYLEVCNNRTKEIKNVLKNTLPNMEQGEFLSEEISQS